MRQTQRLGRRIRLAIVATLAVAGGGVTPALAADEGTVGATVTVAADAACLELSALAVDFGTLALGAEDEPASPTIGVTNCGSTAATLLARGSNATAPVSATWSLVDSTATCATMLGTNNYRLSLATAALAAPLRLATTNKTVEILAADASATHTARIFTACPGSTGAGQTMSLQITYLVTG